MLRSTVSILGLLCLAGSLLHSEALRKDYEALHASIRAMAGNKTLEAVLKQHVREWGLDKKEGMDEFPCKILKSTGVPTSVHRLTPADVNVVAAMGDSITAGTAITAKTIIGLIETDRGLSWSIGGEETVKTVVTLPNILKMYNPNLKGYATGPAFAFELNKKSHLNIADPGATSHDMPGQARLLVQKLKDEPGVDFLNDWKVITLFIGGNDLCAYCKREEDESPQNYISRIREALDILHREVPRAFVNLMETVDVSLVRDLNRGLVCSLVHHVECSCGAYPSSEQTFQELLDTVKEYQQLTDQLIADGRYETRDDFTVVAQPAFRNTVPPVNEEGQPDLSYFSPDCFHFSLKGHRAAAEGLWNNMVEPVGDKRTQWSPGEPIECPSEDFPYFFTNKNSDPELRKSHGHDLGHGAVQTQQQPNMDSRSFAETPGGVVLIVGMAVLVMGLALVAVAMARKKKMLWRRSEYDALVEENVTVTTYT